jgi:hypothetical protein
LHPLDGWRAPGFSNRVVPSSLRYVCFKSPNTRHCFDSYGKTDFYEQPPLTVHEYGE